MAGEDRTTTSRRLLSVVGWTIAAYLLAGLFSSIFTIVASGAVAFAFSFSGLAHEPGRPPLAFAFNAILSLSSPFILLSLTRGVRLLHRSMVWVLTATAAFGLLLAPLILIGKYPTGGQSFLFYDFAAAGRWVWLAGAVLGPVCSLISIALYTQWERRGSVSNKGIERTARGRINQ